MPQKAKYAIMYIHFYAVIKARPLVVILQLKLASFSLLHLGIPGQKVIKEEPLPKENFINRDGLELLSH